MSTITYNSNYSDADKDCVAWIIQSMQDNDVSRAKLARMVGKAQGTISSVLNGSYATSPSSVLRSIRSTFERGIAMVNGGHEVKMVQTSIFRTVRAACYRAHVYRGFSVVPANVGTGKTVALREYARQNPSSILIDGLPSMTASVVIAAILERAGAIVDKPNPHTQGTLSQRVDAIIKTLKGTDHLLIIDEAETLTAGALEYIRRIRDLANVGVVLAGTERLYSMLRSTQGKFGQISSRVTYWAKPQRNITREDVYALTDAYMVGLGVQLNDDIRETFWHCCDGSARVLVEGLIPGIKDYVLNEGQDLTPEAIHEVAHEILGYGVSP